MEAAMASTRSGSHVVLDDKLAAELRGRLRGPLIAPGDAGYDDARSVWNAMIDRRPAGVVRCAGVSDVVACVAFGGAHDVPISIKAGGHNISGLAVADGALTLDLSAMRGVWVDPAARRAHAQAGCLLGDVDAETQLHGLAAPLGFISTTGIAGLTLGGGFGYLTRRFGLASDSVASMNVVTADARVVRASDGENPDLFWALRGGGGNFGVVTSFDYRLQAVGPEIVGGAVAWHARHAEELLGLYRKVIDDAPPEFTCVAAMRIAPPAPWIAKEAHGKPIVVFFVCDSGPLDEAERRASTIKQWGAPVGDVLQRRTYLSQQKLIDATQPKGRRYYWKSEYVAGLDGGLFSAMIEHAAKIVSPHSAVIIFPLFGAINRTPNDHSAAGNRDARYVVNITSSWESAQHDAENVEWARAAWRDMRRFSTGGTYVNFLTEDEGDERVRAAYGGNYERLVDAKTKWDPQNRFRINKNIAPRAA
jgi:FAD/FMN-containing dehydrogenase